MGLNIQRESAWENIFWIFLNTECLKNNLKLPWQVPHPQSTRMIMTRYGGIRPGHSRRPSPAARGRPSQPAAGGRPGLGLVCVPAHAGFVFVWFFVGEKNLVMIFTTTHSPPPDHFHCHHWNPQGECTVCDEEICLFSALQTLDRVQGPPFPQRPALVACDLHFIAIHWTRRRRLNQQQGEGWK